MPIQRLATPLISTLRISRQSQPHMNQICLRCLRPLLIQSRSKLASRRANVSTTSKRPQELATQQQPPRNAGIPETSIAGGKAVDFGNQSSSQSEKNSTSNPARSSIAIPEAEAQEPRPVEQETPGPAVGKMASETVGTPSASQGKTQRKSKLRPRKAALTLTPAAVTQLRDMLNQPDPKLIRVGVKNRGCSGLAYHLEYVEKPGSFDEAVEQDGVKVLVDSKALFSIIGSEMDWIEDKLSRRFIFKNPNITEQCGCGESFSIN